jgi:outer membrane protein OmpA-like peptidoglycan-associated protein
MPGIGPLALAFDIFAATSAIGAEPAPQYSSDEFVKAILSGPMPCPKGSSLQACEANPKTRRFSLATAPELTGANRIAHSAGPAHQAKLSSHDVLVTFALGSAEITEQGQANLRSVAAGLNKAALAEVSFEVAGFTDVTGSPETNHMLSQRRAEAVKTYLVSLNVQANRLSTMGYGADHLIDPTDPTSQDNRRVELHRKN